MSETDSPAGKYTDVAALSAGVIAVVVTLFLTPGEYSVLDFIVSFTFIILIFAYVWPRKRSWLQSLAVAGVIGLSFMTIVAYLDEARLSRSPFELLIGTYEWDCNLDPCNSKGERESRVRAVVLVLGWLAALGVTFAFDRQFQRGPVPD
jgi:lysylphosphatidylglycerol synthetase-like protein (DUF2156 family)